MEQVTRESLINLYCYLLQVDIKGATAKTAYWISKNLRILGVHFKEFETFKNELLETPVFTQYLEEHNSSESEEAKAKIREKYKHVELEAEKELKAYTTTLVNVPEYYKIKIDNVDGIDGNIIRALFDLIDSD